MTLAFLLLAAVSLIAACIRPYKALRARNRRRLAFLLHGLVCDSSDGLGISVLCSGIDDSGAIEELLASEYPCYEVILVLDSLHRPEQFARIAARYRMLRVEYASDGRFRVPGVRSLNRSRRRCYRRLLLLDRAHDTRCNDLWAAAAVASYDYLLPLDGSGRLLSDSLLRLAAELGCRPYGTLQALRSTVGAPLFLFHRETEALAYGFGPQAFRHVPRSVRRTLHEPFFRKKAEPAREIRWRAVGGIPRTALCIVSLATGRGLLTALLLTAAAVLCAGACTQRIDAATGNRRTEYPDIRHRLRKFGVKDFTI